MNYTQKTLHHGYTNQILHVDLTTGDIEACPLDPQVRDFFIGGRGLGLYLLHEKINARTKAYDPENPLIFSPGPLGGIPQFPGTSKCMAVSLSPLTRIPGVSNFGGHFGAYLKYAGFDALTITGIAKDSVMIVIDGFKREIIITGAQRADQVFGLEKDIVDQFLHEGHEKKDMAFLTTGIGAANTAFGCINSHYYDATKPVDGKKGLFRTKQAGRTGLGSVMNHKNITAIVVLAAFPHGDNPYGAADWGKVKEAGGRLHKIVRDVDPQALQMHLKGSAGLISFMNKDEYQSLPVNNYQLGSHPQAGQICGKTYAERIFDHRGMDGCFPGCNLRCTKGGWVTLTTGMHVGRKVWVDGPEYETAAGFGSNLGMWHPEFIMEANWHCDNYGIDTITTAVIMAFLMECYQRGYLVKEDTDGFALTWGDEQAALQFIHDLACRKTELARIAGRGMVELTAWVAEQYAARTGRPEPVKDLQQFAMQTKGLPFSLYRTHRSLSMQASYAAASDIGAHHAAAWLVKVDLLGAFPTFEAKAQALITYPRVRLGNDNLGLCKLPWVDVFNPDSLKRGDTDIYINPASQELYADFYNGMLGTTLTWEKIFEQTDRDINLQRVMNVLSFGAATGERDWIPDRAIGPTDDALYEREADYNDRALSTVLNKPFPQVQAMETGEKRAILMKHRKEELRKLISVYYRQRGWTDTGIPKVETLKQIGLWQYLSDEVKATITGMNG
ncbi:MAG: aldehyde:ferredoxin oxidoreductase, bis-(molybdopterin)-oxotungsten-containing [Deltaproteobacteria bacterium]|nr:aldehyde:ferredoxin oxidoreductase, bis-(molybdopterin)-oxotungsten-containing [Deltaproteobacteria bacterium]